MQNWQCLLHHIGGRLSNYFKTFLSLFFFLLLIVGFLFVSLVLKKSYEETLELLRLCKQYKPKHVLMYIRASLSIKCHAGKVFLRRDASHFKIKIQHKLSYRMHPLNCTVNYPKITTCSPTICFTVFG